jgi:hypothetical protein
MTTEQENEKVHEAIVAVAARCDGAITLDEKGFNGVDTHFGRRIAQIPYAEWSDAVKEEAAHIILKYREQVLAYTGIDVSELGVVKAAQDWGTNYAAREEAARHERQLKDEAKKAELRRVTMTQRRVDVTSDGTQLEIHFSKKDPDFSELKRACQNLPKRRFDWDQRVLAWVTPVSEAVEDLILTWDLPLTPEAQALLQKPRDVHFDVTLDGDKIRIERPYNPAEVAAIQKLPGRAYVGGNFNRVDPDPMVDVLATQFGWKVHPDARAACMAAKAALESHKADELTADGVRTVLARVSRLRRPEDLPEVFLGMLRDAYPEAGA